MAKRFARTSIGGRIPVSIDVRNNFKTSSVDNGRLYISLSHTSMWQQAMVYVYCLIIVYIRDVCHKNKTSVHYSYVRHKLAWVNIEARKLGNCQIDHSPSGVQLNRHHWDSRKLTQKAQICGKYISRPITVCISPGHIRTRKEIDVFVYKPANVYISINIHVAMPP